MESVARRVRIVESSSERELIWKRSRWICLVIPFWVLRGYRPLLFEILQNLLKFCQMTSQKNPTKIFLPIFSIYCKRYLVFFFWTITTNTFWLLIEGTHKLYNDCAICNSCQHHEHAKPLARLMLVFQVKMRLCLNSV